ncbi:unnamed protein product [Phytophthora lilii]|uniref:Unnamed protein product n=1 Tax=Phytophthora lilii TaxID=2077276 RepID=A0A9W7D8K4_9STRA|nr:unnamed protein product [Phytophthora lilii]
MERSWRGVFESEQFKQWSASVAKAFKKKSELGDLAMVSTMTRRFSDDAVKNLIVAAKQASTTRDFAKRSEKAQLKYWINEGKTADDVFKLDQVDDLLGSSMLSTWMSYMTLLGKNRNKTLFAVLKERNTDEVLPMLIVAAKSESKKAHIARGLENVQIKY